jgi:hypothetical protein
MKNKKLILTLLAVSFQAKAAEWIPSSTFLQAICQIESSNGRFLYGDGGRSLGHFQLSRPAWKDVNAWRKSRGLQTYPYSGNVMNPMINREFASNYLTLLHDQLRERLGREPSGPELYASYNIGLVGFAQCNFDVARVNPTTRTKCQQIQAILAAPPTNPLANASAALKSPKKSS